jgi:hypothetical protein
MPHVNSVGVPTVASPNAVLGVPAASTAAPIVALSVALPPDTDAILYQPGSEFAPDFIYTQ